MKNSHLRQTPALYVAFRGLREQIDEEEGGRHSQVKVKNLENEMLHAKHLLFSIGIVCDVHKLAHVGRIDFLVFPIKNTLF